MNTNLDTQSTQIGDRLDHTPAAAVSAGDIVDLGKNNFGFADNDIGASVLGAVAHNQVRRAKKAVSAGVTFAVGDDVVWDDSASLAVPADKTANEGDVDKLLGVCVKAAADAENSVAFLPRSFLDRYSVIAPFVRQFDCEDGVDETGGTKNTHTLVPAAMNRTGLVFEDCFALVDEVFAGAGEDQGVVTIEDSDGNALGTISVADSGADTAGDVRKCTNTIAALSDGDAAKTVPAGKGIRGQVTQKTSGAGAAGQLTVYVRVKPLL
jgi:predicted RecA/RadA family phage recombinase